MLRRGRIGPVAIKSTKERAPATPLPTNVIIGHDGLSGDGEYQAGRGAMTGIFPKAIAAAAAWALAGAAQAENIGAVTADELEAALSEAGLNPTMLADAATGAPVASGAAGQFSFIVRALDCSGQPPACENLLFFANFDLGRTADAEDFRIVNSFNDSQVFGRAYVLEKKDQVGVDFVIELGGGVSEEHLAQNIGRWADVIAAFVQRFQEGPPAS